MGICWEFGGNFVEFCIKFVEIWWEFGGKSGYSLVDFALMQLQF